MTFYFLNRLNTVLKKTEKLWTKAGFKLGSSEFEATKLTTRSPRPNEPLKLPWSVCEVDSEFAHRADDGEQALDGIWIDNWNWNEMN